MERQPPDRQRQDHVERYKFARDVIEWAERKVQPTERRVLDAACGTGYGTAILAQKYPAVGVDIHAPAVKTARDCFPQCDFIEGDVRKKCWNGHFLAAVSFETIEHIEHPEKALKLFRDSANILICSVPNENAFPFDAEKFKGNEYPHLRHYTPREFSDLVESCGWSVLLKMHQPGKESPVREGDTGRTLVYVAI